MKLGGNTIFITGGGSGIGQALAAALHQLGNQVIISGRRKANLSETIRANPGMQAVELDVEKPNSIAAVANKLVTDHPRLNVLINNAGIMLLDDVSTVIDDKLLVSTVTTNLLGPIRVTSALIEHLKRQPSATVINVSSALAFVPLAMTAVYSSTKAAMHSYSQSLRYKLAGSSVKVVELAPPWVQTDLLDSRNEPRAMPLAEFISEVIRILGTDTDEVVVEQAMGFRKNPGPSEAVLMTQFNDSMAAVRN